MRTALLSFTCILVCCLSLRAQDPNATVSGRVLDPSGAVVLGTQVTVINDATNIGYSTATNETGIYSIQSIPPGKYHIQVSKNGFKSLVKPDVILHVQDAVTINFTLEIGAASESVTVEGGAPLINTQNAAVSTVIDRQFVENLPLNGRSFNTLLQLTPGVVIGSNGSTGLPGQFSVAGQRTSANNFTVDGVSANFGVNPFTIVGSGTGSAQAFSALGGTSSLVSVDALQEFRVETSSFAPEFGRAPGGQVILTTRSGANTFHGGLYEYFRNEVMDANDWFSNQASILRVPERHNDFGGFIGGRIWKDRTFFFFSYEGARLRIPTTSQITVPSADARTGKTSPAASAAIMPFLNTYPLPNGPVAADDFTAQFTGAFSNRATLDATSIRIDHTFNDRFSIFGRYSNAPSQLASRTGSLNSIQSAPVDTQTLTLGTNMILSSRRSNTIRGNYSVQSSSSIDTTDSFGGAVPLDPSLLLGGLSAADTVTRLLTFDTASYQFGPLVKNKSRQLYVGDDLSGTTGSHLLKFGGDYRIIFVDAIVSRNLIGFTAPSVQALISTGSATFGPGIRNPSYFSSQSLSLYGQDTWKITQRLTMSYGLRWEYAPAPAPRRNTTAASWMNTDDPANLALAPFGTPLWNTTYTNFAPRAGIAYRLNQNGDFVLRAGWGLFYDLGSDNAAAVALSFPNSKFGKRVVVSLPASDVTPFLPTISTQPPFPTIGTAFSQNLKLPRSHQWNIGLEKVFGGKQALSATYVGQAGRNLPRTAALFQPNSNFPGDFFLTDNSAYSNYHALQVQYRRTLSAGLQALASYTWSHALDNASDDVTVGLSSTVISAASDYASSSFDVRHSFSGAFAYSLPAAAKSGALALLTRNWSIDTVLVARSGFPFNATVFGTSPDPIGFALTRPDIVSGQPFWIANATAPGGKILNVNAFSVPSTTRQGTEGRNDIAGFGLTQIDLSIGRKLTLTERLYLQFRADTFNVLNHPNFVNPLGYFQFGAPFLQSSSMLNQGLGGLNPLFQEGGPRSLQLSLRLTF